MPPPSADQASMEDGDPHPCPEDEEFFECRPDAADMEEAIGKFMEGMENCVVGQFGQHLVSISRGKYIAVRTRTYQYIPVCTELYSGLYKISTYKYILVCTAMYCHEPVYTMFWCSMPT